MASLPVPPALRLEGEVQVPGDKSISHRALFVAAIAEGTTTIEGLSPARDVTSTLRMVTTIVGHSEAGARPISGKDSDGELHVEGSPLSSRGGDSQIVVTSPGRRGWTTPVEPLDVGNSGSTIRMG